MAKRKARKRKRTSSTPSRLSAGRKRAKKAVSGKRPTRKSRPVRRMTAKKQSRPARRTPDQRRSTPPATRLDRVRKTLEETVQTPPSSLNMVRRGTAVRTGRAEIAESLEQHRGMSPDITGGDVDVDVEDAYFNGDEAPGGDNPTPDQDIVDDIGKAIGVEYQDNEELRGSDKVAARDKHRWELDPASAEDYKERK